MKQAIGQLLVGLAAALLLAPLPGLHAADASPAVLRILPPLSVRGVNYFPRETPWGGLWTKTPAEVWEKDMALAASLGCNTVRTFVQFAPHAGTARSAAT